MTLAIDLDTRPPKSYTPVFVVNIPVKDNHVCIAKISNPCWTIDGHLDVGACLTPEPSSIRPSIHPLGRGCHWSH